MSLFHPSLRARITLAVTGIMLLMMLVTAIGTLTYFENEYEKSLKSNQTAMLALLANGLDSSIKTAQTAICSNAAAFPAEALQSHQATQLWLESRTGLKKQFFTLHLLLVNQQGELLAFTPHDHTNLDQSTVKLLKDTISSGKPLISPPLPCSHYPNELQLMFTAPINLPDGRKLALAGSFSLMHRNFISDFLQSGSGKDGFTRLLNREHRVVMHTDPSRLNQPVALELGEALDRVFASSNGETISHQGVKGQGLITSLKKLQNADLVVATSYLAEDAYHPAAVARYWFIGATLAGMGFAVLVIWLMMNRLTRPLAVLARHVAQLPEKSGEDRFIHLPVNGEIGNLTGAFNQMVQQLEGQTRELQGSEQRYRIVTEFTNDFTYWRRPDGSFEFLSPACFDLTGYHREELYQNPDLMELMIHPDDRQLCEQMASDSGEPASSTDMEFEYRIVTKGGEVRWVRHTCRQIIDENGNYLGRRGCRTDITERKHLADQVSHMVLHDLLTGLPNRSLFADRLFKLVSQKGVGTQDLNIVMFFGIDRFKLINDTLGHEVGDQLLVMVAERLQQLLQPGDIISRFGGDVFGFILPDRTNRHEAVTMSYRILSALENPFNTGMQQIMLSGSIGIALFPQDGISSDAVLKNAESAMYDAKRSGKNCFRFYASEMNAQAAELLRIDNSMPQSLVNGDFYLNFQPQLDLETDEVVAVEALLRWRHPDMGQIPPDRFIPLAEENGFIIKLGEWVLRTACQQCASWQTSLDQPLRVAVNISGRQFNEPEFVDMVTDVLNSSGLAPELLELELTESLLISNAQQALQKLQLLKGMQIHLAIDDFGTGYSSLAYLKHFPLDRLKVDKSFVDEILVSQDDAAITEAIIAMGRSLKLKVIAEGVETMEQLAFLQDRGCNEIQGYYLSKPLSERDLMSFMAARGEKADKRNLS